MNRMITWLDVGALEHIPLLGSRVVHTSMGDVAIFRTNDDRVFAIYDRCPHRGGPLSQGIVHGASVTCPLHNWVINLESGLAEAPDEGCVERVALEIKDGRLWLGLPALAQAANA